MKNAFLKRNIVSAARLMAFGSCIPLLLASQARANIIVMREGDSVDNTDWFTIAIGGAIGIIILAIIILLWLQMAARRRAAEAARVAEEIRRAAEKAAQKAREEELRRQKEAQEAAMPPQRHIQLAGQLPDGSLVSAEVSLSELESRSRGNYYSIGRKTGNDFQIAELSVSRMHAELRAHNGEFTVGDVGSSGGTELNGRKLDPKNFATLNNGDRVKFGSVVLTVRILNK